MGRVLSSSQALVILSNMLINSLAGNKLSLRNRTTALCVEGPSFNPWQL